MGRKSFGVKDTKMRRFRNKINTTSFREGNLEDGILFHNKRVKDMLIIKENESFSPAVDSQNLNNFMNMTFNSFCGMKNETTNNKSMKKTIFQRIRNQ